jgi:hypothetical protein
MFLELPAGGVQVVDLEGDVRRHPDPYARPGIVASRTTRRVTFDEEVELVLADLEPGAGEYEVVRSRNLLETERASVEGSRVLEIGDDQPAVLETSGHAPKPNRKERRCR